MLKATSAALFLIAAGAALQPGAGDAAPRSDTLSLEYQATLLGLPLAAVSATVDPGALYRLTGTMETRGVVGLFSPWYHQASSVGHLSEDGRDIVGVRHRGDGVHRGESRFMQLLFDPETTTIEAAEPDPDTGSKSRRVPPALRTGTLDPLSAFYALALRLDGGQGCGGPVKIFDGRHRYDLVMAEGPDALSCRFAYRPLAGFKRKSAPTVDASDETPGLIRYTRVAEGFPPIPERLEVPSRFGSVVVALTGWNVETRTAAASQ